MSMAAVGDNDNCLPVLSGHRCRSSAGEKSHVFAFVSLSNITVSYCKLPFVPCYWSVQIFRPWMPEASSSLGVVGEGFKI